VLCTYAPTSVDELCGISLIQAAVVFARALWTDTADEDPGQLTPSASP